MGLFFPFQFFLLNPIADGSSNAVLVENPSSCCLKKPNLNRPHLLQSYVYLCECKICQAAFCLLISHPLRTKSSLGKLPVRCALLATLDTSNAKISWEQEEQWLHTALPFHRGKCTILCGVYCPPARQLSEIQIGIKLSLRYFQHIQPAWVTPNTPQRRRLEADYLHFPLLQLCAKAWLYPTFSLSFFSSKKPANPTEWHKYRRCSNGFRSCDRLKELLTV